MTTIKKNSKIKNGGEYVKESENLNIYFNSIQKFKKSIFNYPDFVNLFKIVKYKPHNKNVNNNFWYNMLDPLKDVNREVELSIYSGNQKTGTILRYQNLFIICNISNNLFEIRFKKFNENKSQLYIPFPIINTFNYTNLINEYNSLDENTLINRDLLKIFNLQKSWIVKNKKKLFNNFMNKLYFRYDINLNKWKTNLNQLYILLGFQYSNNNPEILINPDEIFWNIDVNLTNENKVLTSNQSEIGISGISVKVVNI